MMKFDGKLDLMVTGIFEPIPQQSHIHFDCLVSFSTLKNILGPNIGSKNWVWNPCWTYILLKDESSAASLEKQFPGFIKKYFPDFIIPQATLYLQKLTDIHLTSKLDYELEQNSDRADVNIFAAIGIFVLIIACINYMNLATARASKRAKEVGMRKVFGSFRKNLLQQFLGESVFVSLLALFSAILLVLVFLPAFNSLSGKEISFWSFLSGKFFIGLLFLTLLVGLLSGIYPALFLSSFEPVQVLKGTFKRGTRSRWFRQGLVVLQFSVSLALIIGTAVIYKQLKYLRSADLGFNKEQVIVLPVRPPMAAVYLPFSEELKRSGRVINVATMNDMLGVSHNTHEYNYEGMSPDKKWIYFPSLIVSPEFISTMGIKIVAGRGFNKDIKSDDSLAVVINESMVKHLGWGKPENALGRQFFTPQGKERVIGVAKDFNFVSLKETVGPFVLDIAGKNGKIFWTKYIVIRIPQKHVQETIAFIDAKWNEFSKEYPFEYFFLDENINKTYRSQANLGKLVAYFSVLAIFIACLGLFALASFTAEQRKREIGIRKVLGAPLQSIATMMSREFVKLVIIAVLIACPFTWLLMHQWLENFAYRIAMGPGVFIFSSLLILSIALLTVSFHALRAALSNPVQAIKYE
jgi:putative ABC transport system permease protein